MDCRSRPRDRCRQLFGGRVRIVENSRTHEGGRGMTQQGSGRTGLIVVVQAAPALAPDSILAIGPSRLIIGASSGALRSWRCRSFGSLFARFFAVRELARRFAIDVPFNRCCATNIPQRADKSSHTRLSRHLSMAPAVAPDNTGPCNILRRLGFLSSAVVGSASSGQIVFTLDRLRRSR